MEHRYRSPSYKRYRHAAVLVASIVALWTAAAAAETPEVSGYRDFRFDMTPEQVQTAAKPICQSVPNGGPQPEPLLFGEKGELQYVLGKCYEIAGDRKDLILYFDKQKKLNAVIIDVDIGAFNEQLMVGVMHALTEKYGKASYAPSEEMLKAFDAGRAQDVSWSFAKGQIKFAMERVRQMRVSMIHTRLAYVRADLVPIQPNKSDF